MPPAPIDVAANLRDRDVLLTGVTGFLGKVWLAMALEWLPDLGTVHVLIRPRGTRSARERFHEVVATSPVFTRLRRIHGSRLSAWLSDRVHVVEGDVSEPQLGLADDIAEQLAASIDLVLHCAGLVDFDPDIRDALLSNVDGPLNVAAFAARADAPMIHVSTCFVAGIQQGRIDEQVSETNPHGDPIDASRELDLARRAIERTLKRCANDDAQTRAVARAKRRWARQEREPAEEPEAFAVDVARALDDSTRETLVDEGRRRSARLGWPNTYTYSKSLGERLLLERFPRGTIAIVRPAIVESAFDTPFPGWNEGFNTCGPLAYLVGTWFKHMPARRGNPFDIVPVDDVARALFLVGAALLDGRAAVVYQIGTSDQNQLTIDRALELTALSHRRRLRTQGSTLLDRWVRSRWDTTPVAPDFPLAAGGLATFARNLSEQLSRAARGKKGAWPTIASRIADNAARSRRPLERLERVTDLFQPFTHDLHQVFTTANIRALNPTDARFAFVPERINWRDYWFDVHMPGLRKWTFPLLRGEEPPGAERLDFDDAGDTRLGADA